MPKDLTKSWNKDEMRNLAAEMQAGIVEVDIDCPDSESGVNTAVLNLALKEGDRAEQRQAIFILKVRDGADAWAAALAATSANTTIDTATKGTILAGAGTDTLIIQTDANGEFSATVSNTVADETVFVMAEQVPAGNIVQSNIDPVEFVA